MTGFLFAHVKRRSVALAITSAVACALIAGSAAAFTPTVYKTCTAFNKRYPHGVGKVGARDRTSGDPVTTFKRSNQLYRFAMSFKPGLDRDMDGIACEKK